MCRPLQALIACNSCDYPSIAIKSVFLLGRRCLRHASGWGKEPTKTYLSLFLKLKFPTHLGTTSISFLLPHCLSHIVTSAAEYGRLWIQELLSVSRKLKSVPGSCSVGFLPLQTRQTMLWALRGGGITLLLSVTRDGTRHPYCEQAEFWLPSLPTSRETHFRFLNNVHMIRDIDSLVLQFSALGPNWHFPGFQ